MRIDLFALNQKAYLPDLLGKSDACLQGLKNASSLLNEGLASILQALKSYQQQSVILRSWQDVFVDLVQGHVQHLFLSLLEGVLAFLGTAPLTAHLP